MKFIQINYEYAIPARNLLKKEKQFTEAVEGYLLLNIQICINLI